MLFLDFQKGIVNGMLNRWLLVRLSKIKPEIPWAFGSIDDEIK